MSNEEQLKKRIAQILGVSVLATGLTTAPLTMNTLEDGVAVSAAWAKGGEGGDSGGESGGDDSGGESGESGGNDSGGESGESGDDSGGESGESGDDNGGESGESGDDSGESGESGDDSGESGESGDDNGGESGRSGKRGGSGRSSAAVPERFGRVVKFETTFNSMEIRYSDNWKEEIENGRYELKDPNGRTVVERRATFADRARISSAGRRAR